MMKCLILYDFDQIRPKKFVLNPYTYVVTLISTSYYPSLLNNTIKSLTFQEHKFHIIE